MCWSDKRGISGGDVGEERFGEVGRTSAFNYIKSVHRRLVLNASMSGQPRQRTKERNDMVPFLCLEPQSHRIVLYFLKFLNEI